VAKSGETDETADDRRERYHRLLETVRHQTGDPQHVMVAGSALWTVINNGHMDTSDAITTMQAAIENGHCIQWTDADGRHRYALTGDGVAEAPHATAPLYGPADETQLRAVIKTEAESDEPNRDVIGWANQRLAAIEAGE